jgi:quinate/shikimate dehydrogenase (NAD+)
MPEKVQLGLLGNGLSRSRAKNLHELLGKMHGLNVDYRVMDLAGQPGSVSIARELQRCRDEGFRGVNVTHPYKCDAFLCVKLVDDFPRGLNSVNTVLFGASAMKADNTDFSGFYHAFLNRFGGNSSPGRVLMFGAGGVGVAIAFALYRLGVSELVIHDIRAEKAQELVRQLTANSVPARVAGQDLLAEMHHAEGLINATPVGMFQYPGNPFPVDGFGRQKWAFDAVYTPENTEFLDHCRKRSIDTLSGFRLFLYQGLHAFERFTGITPDAAVTETKFLKLYPLA